MLTLEQKKLLSETTDETIRAAEAELALQKAKQISVQESASVITAWQKFVLMVSGKDLIRFDGKEDAAVLEKALQNGKEAAAGMDDGLNDLILTIAALKDGGKGLKEIVNAEALGDAIGMQSVVMMQEKLGKYKITLDNAVFGGEDYIRIQQKIQEVEKKMGTKPKWISDDEIAIEIEVLEAAFNKKQSLIRQDYLKGIDNEDTYNDKMLLSELEFHAKKLTIYNVGSQEYQEAVNKVLELQVTVDNKLRDLKLKAEEELASAKIEKTSAMNSPDWRKQKNNAG